MSYAPDSRASGNRSSQEDAPPEAVGPIASDSLAADSLRDGGDFADGDAVPSSVKGASSTFNTTDTSGATALHPAASGTAREEQDFEGLGSDERGPGGVKYPDAEGVPQFTGRHNLEGYTGGPSADRVSSGYSTQPTGASDFTDDTSGGSDPGSAGVRPYVDAAPSYAARVAGVITGEGDDKPKGKDLIEGDIPATETFTGDVGGPDDPGRLAEQQFEKTNAESRGEGITRDYGQDGGDENPFDSLKSSENA